MRPPESWRNARVTLVMAGVTAAIWLLTALFGLDRVAILWGGFIPVRFHGAGESAFLAPFFLTPLTAALVHANLMHVAFNLLMLLFCGRAVEAILGPVGLILLYLIGAYVAAAGHYFLEPAGIVPMIGASGAISAVLGAYAMLFGRNKVRVSEPRLATALHALWLLVAWVALQLILGIVTSRVGIGVAVGAHIGGFIAGVALAKPLLMLRWRKA